MKKSLLFLVFLLSFSILNGQKPGHNLDVVFIGNSITQGVQLEKPQEMAPPAYATTYLLTKKNVVSAQFLNRGRSGFTTINFLPSVDGELSKVIPATEEFHTNIDRLLVFSISLGTNDSAEEGPKGAPVSKEDYRKNIKSITDELLTVFPDCIVVLQQPIWYSPTTYNRSRYLAAGLARLQSYFPELKSLVKEYSRNNPGRVYMGDNDAFDYFSKNYLTDLIPESGQAGTFYLHPNKKGAEALGNFWGDGIYRAVVSYGFGRKSRKKLVEG